MHHPLSKPLIVFLMLLSALPATLRADVVKGRVVDAETQEPIPEATIELSQQTEWYTWRSKIAADSLGCFSMRLGGRATLTASMLGYYSKTKAVMGFSDESTDTIDVGDIALRPSETLMKMLEVKGRARRFTMRGDTIVFNPEAFHLQEGARLDELIRQLPGVQVDEGGGLTWNGKPIRITMDGQSLVGGDELVGQLPAEAVQDIKAYNKASKFSERTGKDDGGEDMVLDLTIKPGFLDRWYGDAKAGYQTPKHYDAELTMNRLSKTDPMLIYADANNIARQRRRSGMHTGWGIYSNGYGQEQGASAAYEHRWKKKDGTQEREGAYGVSAGMAHDDSWSSRGSITENFAPDAIVSRTTTNSYNRDHKLDPTINLTWRSDIDTLNTFNIDADFGHNRTRSNGHTEMEQEGLLQQNTRTHGEGHETHAHVEGMWAHYMKGSAELGASFDLSWRDALSEDWTDRDIIPAAVPGASAPSSLAPSSLTQYSHTPTKGFSASAEVHYKNWLAKRWLAEVAYSADYDMGRVRNTFMQDDSLDAANSYRDHGQQLQHNLSLASTIDLKTVKLMPRLRTRWQQDWKDYERGALDTTATRQRLMLDPSLSVRGKLSPSAGFDASYSRTTSAPDIMQTLAYRDATNPLSIAEGNPGLKDTHTSDAKIGFNGMVDKHQLMLSTSVAFHHSDRETRAAQLYNPATGVYVSRPVNVRGSQSWTFKLNYDQGLGDLFRLRNDFSLTTDRRYGLLMQLLTVASETPSAPALLNRQQSLNPKDRITVSLDLTWLKASAFADVNVSRLTYSASPEQNTTIWRNQFGCDAELTRGPFVFNTSLKEYMYSGYTEPSMNRNMLIWDASVTWKIWKNKMRLRLEADDILNNHDSHYCTQSAYQQTTSWFDFRHHYIGLSVTYHLDAKVKE